MARILDIPIGTVRSRLHRARAILKDSLAAYAKSKGYH
jgi:RNA polymerase sigma-70 factor (ECF subfamily)